MTEPQRFFVFATFAKYKYRYICYIPDPLRSFSTPPWLLPLTEALCIFPPRISSLEVTTQNVFGKSLGFFGIERRVRDHFKGVFQERI